jgi:biopolymer transport protein ExbD
MRLPQAPPKRARIEIVPMIDAIFFLLVFFMFSSLSMIKLSGMPVALPQTPGPVPGARSRPGPAKNAPHLMVVVRETGGCMVGNRSVAAAAVTAAVQEQLSERPETLVILQARKGSGMQQLVSTMDALNRVRLKEGGRPTVLIATQAVTNPDTQVRSPAAPP